jgi:uncharacterized protein YcbK (DUF882 family)
VSSTKQWRLVVLGGASRRTREVSLAKGVVALLLWLVMGLPLTAGVLLGSRHATAQRPAAHLATRQELRLPWSARRASYVLFGRAAVPIEPIELEPPPAPPEPVLGRVPKTPEHRRGHLRIASLHHGESIDVVPWNELGEKSEQAFAEIARLWRCRVTGHEIAVDEKLVKLLITLNDLYDKPLYLISGHRTPHTIDTSPTSQHVTGTAADVRVPGISIEELREVALELGARGVGLYTHNRFVHIDFRPQRKYQWTDIPEGHATTGDTILANVRGGG